MTINKQAFHFEREQWILWSIHFGVMGVLLGRGWQHFFSHVPYWSWLWDESLMRPIITGWFGLSWDTYVTGESTIGTTINYVIWCLGAWLIITGLITSFWGKVKGLAQLFLFGSGLILLLVAGSTTKDHFYRVIQLIEYSLQVGAPFVLWAYIRIGKWEGTLDLTLRILTSLTFLGHGWYAIGYYFPRPALFTEMTMAILHLSQGHAEWFLVIMGILDVIAAILLFVRWKRIDRMAIGYCIVWGFLTALARIWAHFHPGWIADTLWQWGPEFVLRFPHFMLPLALWFGDENR